MSDLIDRKAILKKIENIRNGVQMMDDTHRASIVMTGMHLCEEAVRNQPSAEPEIIRCKDCKHYVIHTLFGHRQGWCERLCDEYDKSLARGTEEDDFCSRAEERRR